VLGRIREIRGDDVLLHPLRELSFHGFTVLAQLRRLKAEIARLRRDRTTLANKVDRLLALDAGLSKLKNKQEGLLTEALCKDVIVCLRGNASPETMNRVEQAFVAFRDKLKKA
jgi:hypothetical protein